MAGLLILLATTTARADAVEDAAVFVDGLTGRDIYERVIANRFRSFAQNSTLVSADRAGRQQESRFHMKWQDFRPEDGNGDGESPPEGARTILSKAIVRYTHPFDLRHAGYLIQSNRNRVNDQFVYYPSKRRVVRVSLRSEAVYGTDFSFEDVVPREAEDFAYRRLADSEVDDVPVYVVELFPRDFADSEYSRIRVFVDRERSVVVRARYWDDAGVEIKELEAPVDKIRDFDGVHVPMEATMRNLLVDSSTTLRVTEIDPNPRFDPTTWDLRRLESH